MFGHGTIGIDLDKKIEMSTFRLVRNGRVWANYGLLGILRFEFGDDCSCKSSARSSVAGFWQLTCNIQTADLILRKLEDELLGVVIVFFDALQL